MLRCASITSASNPVPLTVGLVGRLVCPDSPNTAESNIPPSRGSESRIASCPVKGTAADTAAESNSSVTRSWTTIGAGALTRSRLQGTTTNVVSIVLAPVTGSVAPSKKWLKITVLGQAPYSPCAPPRTRVPSALASPPSAWMPIALYFATSKRLVGALYSSIVASPCSVLRAVGMPPASMAMHRKLPTNGSSGTAGMGPWFWGKVNAVFPWLARHPIG